VVGDDDSNAGYSCRYTARAAAPEFDRGQPDEVDRSVARLGPVHRPRARRRRRHLPDRAADAPSHHARIARQPHAFSLHQTAAVAVTCFPVSRGDQRYGAAAVREFWPERLGLEFWDDDDRWQGPVWK